MLNRTHRSIARAGLATLVLLVAVASATAGQPKAPKQPKPPNSFVGTWHLQALGAEAFGTLEANGTAHFTQDTNDFADGYTHEATSVGTWQLIAPRSFDGVLYVLTFDEEGTHVVTQRARGRGVLREDDPDVIDLLLVVDVFVAGQDVTDPDAVPFGGTVGPVPGTMRRLKVLPIPELG